MHIGRPLQDSACDPPGVLQQPLLSGDQGRHQVNAAKQRVLEEPAATQKLRRGAAATLAKIPDQQLRQGWMDRQNKCHGSQVPQAFRHMETGPADRD